MNIVKLQQQLESVGDQDLVNYVQNPSSTVPTYLALAELERRKKIRASATAPQQSAKPPVAEQVVQETMGGVAGLDAPNVGTPQAMASGGIVAFADGGYYRGGKRYSDEHATTVYNRAMKNSMFADIGDTLSGMGRELSEVPGYLANEMFGYRLVKDPVTGKMVRADSLYDKDTLKKAYQGTVQERRAAREADNRRAAAVDAINPTVSMPERFDPRMNAYGIDVTSKSPLNAQVPPSASQPAPAGGVSTASSARVASRGAGGIGALPAAADNTYGIPDWVDIEDPRERMLAGMKPVQTREEAIAEYQRAMGDDPARAALAERIKTMEAETAREKEIAPWMALARAGLATAAGKSPNAFTNLAEGANAGVTELQASKQRNRDNDEKLFSLRNQIAQAERAEKAAALKYGMDSTQFQEANALRVQLAAEAASLSAAETNKRGQADTAKARANLADSEANRRNQRQMNAEDNAAAMERTKLTTQAQTKALADAERQRLDAVLKDNSKQIKILEAELANPAFSANKARKSEYDAKKAELDDLKAETAAVKSALLGKTTANVPAAPKAPKKYEGFSGKAL